MPINFEKVSFIYQPDTPFAFQGLNDVSFHIEDGSFTAIIGHTGSGKSTLIQHLNALLRQTKGVVTINDFVVMPETKEKQLKSLRQQVGVVFQFPEAQLFEETLVKDVMFGPLNFGVSVEESRQRAEEALRTVGIDDSLFERSPFDLSGGQMRRVAIAGILAMQPNVLVLDEPTAGLDPKGRLDMMNLFKRLHQEQGLTIVLVTHHMNDVLQYADKVLVMHKGELVKSGTPLDIFSNRQWLVEHEIGLPDSMDFAYRLRQKGVFVPEHAVNVSDMVTYLAPLLKEESHAE